MKKLLASLLVLAMVSPAMAITFSTSASGKVLTINYDLAEGEVLRGLALTVTRQSGDGAVANDQGHNFGPFNTFMDYAYMAPADYQIDTGHPFALVTGAGVATFPASEFSISMGFLDQNGVEPKGEGITTDGSITVTFTGTVATEVAVALDTLRGGAVGDGLQTIDDSGLVNQTLIFEAPFPNCNDYNLTKKKAGLTDPAVNAADLTNFINYVNANKTGTTFVVAPTNPGYDADYNFDAASPAINAADLTKMINFVNGYKTGTTFVVNCTTWVP